MTDFIKINTPRGEGRSMTPLSPTSMHVGYDGGGGDWFGPLSPMPATAPPEVAGRTWDYPTGFNLTTRPRAYEPISFELLRDIASSLDPLRLIIEHQKNAMCRLPWVIRARHEGSGKRPKLAQLSAPTRELIRDVTAFFKKPNGFEMTFRVWLRELLEDALVIDAPALFCERDPRGNLIGLDPVDGATIKLNIDNRGRLPRPVEWSGVTPFIWNGAEVTRENYHSLGWRFHRGLAFPPAYQQVLKGLPAVDYTVADLIYRPLNPRPGRPYGMSPVEQVLMTSGIALKRITSQSQFFDSGNVPAGVLSLPETWNPSQVEQFQNYWDNLFVGHLGNRRQMRFVAGGGKYQPFLEPSLKAEFDEWLIRIICYAFSEPPTPFIQLANRSIAEEHSRTSELNGPQHLKLWVYDLINEIIENEWRTDEIEFSFEEEPEVDAGKEAERLSRLVQSGLIRINEAREKLGEEPDTNPAASMLMVMTPAGLVPIDANLRQNRDADADADDVGVIDDAAKLAKGGVVMLPPKHWQPCARFTLNQTIYTPNLAKGGRLVVYGDHVTDLLREGWSRLS